MLLLRPPLISMSPLSLCSGDFSETTTDTTGHYVHPQSATVSFDLGVEGLQELAFKDSAGIQTDQNNKFQYARVPSSQLRPFLELEAFAVDREACLWRCRICHRKPLTPRMVRQVAVLFVT